MTSQLTEADFVTSIITSSQSPILQFGQQWFM